jgi:hypothetical protein
MYDEYSYDRRDRGRYDQPPPARRRAPPPEEFEPEEDFEVTPVPPPRRGAGPPPAAPPMKPQRFKPQRQPNEIPKGISYLVIIGIIFMFLGLTLLAIATPTTPPPEIPDPDDSDAMTDYGNDLDDWERNYGNSYRNKELIKQVGIVIHGVGVLLAGIGLVGGGLLLNYLDMKLRITLIIVGIVLIVVMFMIPYAWSSLSIPTNPY